MLTSSRARFAAVVVAAIALIIGAVLLNPTSTILHGTDISPDTVVARVQTTARAYSDTLRALLHATRADPANLDAAKKAARATIDEGRNAGDSRMVGAALGILRPFLVKPDAETLYLAATARQYQHDFNGALALLDQALTLDPANINARLSRATIQTVLGRFELAAADCQSIQTGALIGVGFLCQSTAMLLTNQAPAIYKRLKIVTSAPQLLDPNLKPWALGLMGEIAALQGDRPSARQHLQDVLTLNPLAIRERLILADLMLQDGEGLTVTTLLQDAPPTDGVLIRRVLAGQAQGQTDDADTAVLAKRFKLNLDLGLTAHAREEARYYLQIAHDPATALQRAQVNWGLQHEVDDASLLIDAAMAAGQPAAAQPVLQWMAAEGVVIPSLTIPDAVRKAAP